MLSLFPPLSNIGSFEDDGWIGFLQFGEQRTYQAQHKASIKHDIQHLAVLVVAKDGDGSC